MPIATFYLLEEQDIDHARSQAKADSVLLAACYLATRCFRNRQKLWVHCNDKQQAEKFDELLWQQPNAAFVPHNLTGEGNGGAPVELGWSEPHYTRSNALLNLADEFPPFARRFGVAYDFVPAEEARKQLARQRYKQFKLAGFEISTSPAAQLLPDLAKQ